MKFPSKNKIKRKKRLPSARQDNLHLRRSGRYVSPHRKSPNEILGIIVKTLVLPFTIPFLFIEKQIVEPIAHLLDEWDLFRILEKIGFLIAILVFIVEFSDRTEQRIFEAWQVVKDGKGSKSGVVRLAMERLHKEKFTLSGINANKTVLKKIQLNAVDLSDADLSGADLYRANLSNTYLFKTNLKSAILHYANLKSANLKSANLKSADLTEANLSHAKLNGTKLNGTKLSFANLSGADLSGADLNGVNLYSTDLSGAMFWDKKTGREAENITPYRIKAAKNWEKAIYSPEFRKELGLSPEEE